MKNIEIKINKNNRMVDLNKTVIGNDGENLQGNLIFSFADEFVNGQARLEYMIDGNKYYAVLEKKDETYQIPILSIITKKGQIDMQLVITEGINETEIPVFKSNVFYLTCNASINAVDKAPDVYEQWIEIANTKLNEIDNLDIDAVKANGVATITITKKDGSHESVEIYDGGAGTGAGAKDYLVLENKPFINGVELIGDKSLTDLGIDLTTKQDVLTAGENITIENNVISASGGEVPIYYFDGDTTSEDNKAMFEKILNKHLNNEKYIVVYKYNNDDLLTSTEIYAREDLLSIKFNNSLHFSDRTSNGVSYSGYTKLELVYRLNTRTISVSTSSKYILRNYGEILGKSNTAEFTPTNDYNPATKKYVDDQVGSINTILATLTTVEEVAE